MLLSAREGHPHSISYLTQRIHSFILDVRIGLAWRVGRGSRFYSRCYGGEPGVICTWMPYYFVVTKTAVIVGLCPMDRILCCCRDEPREETSAMIPWGIRVWICGEVWRIWRVERRVGVQMMGFDMSKEREKYRKVLNDGRAEWYSKIFWWEGTSRIPAVKVSKERILNRFITSA